ncbi:MAG: hypothetical protein JXQ87_09010 [Bacteroidia bacterium]
MNTGFRYQLEKGSKKHHCPRCGKRSFVPYVDSETNQYLPEQYGRCDREIKCQYHLNPYNDDYHKTGRESEQSFKPFKPIKPKPKKVEFVDSKLLKNSLAQYEQNNFAKWLIDAIGADGATRVIELYFIGTSKHWSGANIFWQIDQLGKVRTGKIMLYNATSGRRVKDPFNHIQWVHKGLNIKDYKQVYFGSHLLAKPENLNKPVAIVESEKTAVIASHYFNQFIWLACGGLQMISKERTAHLKGRDVVLWPDVNCFDKWQAKAEQMGFKCSDFLELRASEADKEKGLDLADYLTRLNAKQQTEPQHETKAPNREKGEKSERLKTNIFCEKKDPQQTTWAIDELQEQFELLGSNLPQIQLKSGERITDPQKFIESHLAIVRANNGKATFQPYWERLNEFANGLM